MKTPLVIPDRTYPFSEDLAVDSSGAMDPNLTVIAKVPLSLMFEVLGLVRTYELVYQLNDHFTLSTGWVNVEVTWSRGEVMMSAIRTVMLTYHHQ